MTRDHPETENLLLNVVQHVSKATLERIERAKSDENEEDQTETDITQGRSVVFSMLEISLYVISKYASDMIPDASKKPSLHTTRKSHKGNCDSIFSITVPLFSSPITFSFTKFVIFLLLFLCSVFLKI